MFFVTQLKPEGEARRSHIIILKWQGHLCFAAYRVWEVTDIWNFVTCVLCSATYVCPLDKSSKLHAPAPPSIQQSNGKVLFAHILVVWNALSKMSIIIPMVTAC